MLINVCLFLTLVAAAIGRRGTTISVFQEGCFKIISLGGASRKVRADDRCQARNAYPALGQARVDQLGWSSLGSEEVRFNPDDAFLEAAIETACLEALGLIVASVAEASLLCPN